MLGSPAWLLAGPPCQGFSSLNNHTRGDDPKNGLYSRAGRAVEVLRPDWVVIENVASVRQDATGAAAKTAAHLRGLGYSVDDAVLPVLRLGVAQGRRRHVLLASRAREVSLEAVLESFGGPARTLQWAIGDLAPARRRRPFDSASKPSPTNRRRMDWLRRAEAYDLPNERRPECHADGDHTYKSMYGRLRWDLPAQTITSGYGSMGQGRYVHPNGRRTITPHEAARIQSFPDWFDFGDRTRSEWATVIGNAVPMKVGYAIAAWALG